MTNVKRMNDMNDKNESVMKIKDVMTVIMMM